MVDQVPPFLLGSYVPNVIPKRLTSMFPITTSLDAQLPWCGGHSLDQVQNQNMSFGIICLALYTNL
jgi:hypothetical protein